jgi:hypothetical protein
MVNYTLKTLELCSDLHKYLFPWAQETLWQSLAPFWIFSGVDPVQCIITRWSCAEIQLNWKKYQTNSEKSQTWWLLHKRHLQAWEKVWDQYDTWTPESLRIQVYRHGSMKGSIYLLWSTWTPTLSKWHEIFLAVIYTKNMVSHKNLHFPDNYFYYYNFLCAAWDKIWWIIDWKH